MGAGDPTPALVGFRLEGWLGDRRVRAQYQDGRLALDDRLATQATLLVDLGEVFELDDLGRSVPATLDGSPEAIFVTLLRSCERVTDAAFELPRATVGAPGPDDR